MAEAFSQGGAARAPWVIVAGGFHRLGGMDKANAALARYLASRGHELHLVTHEVEPELAAHPGVTAHLVRRPAGSVVLGEGLLARRGREVARAVAARDARARVVVNGGNCPWPDINWAHCVHRAWPAADAGAPAWFKAKNRLTGALARARERRALGRARLVVANSERTRRDLLERLGVEPERVRVVRLGGGAGRGAATEAERRAARARLGVSEARAVVAFVGALGRDNNKGFDILWLAWQELQARGAWDADLLVAGGGGGVAGWRARAAASGLGDTVRVLGFVEKVDDVYAAADLLVSPARYESYGLNVSEAVARGTPALVSARAGVADDYPPELGAMLLPDPEDAADLARRLLDWRADVPGWRARFAPLAARLRGRTWDDMAAEFVAHAEGEGAAGGAATRYASCPA
ncbi:MAG TPA: glycosyltransferase family 4 protein [Pyrinomonadaceae bacterium]|jgi:glycosyltransferase involved in cell wall biosynthesis